MTPTFLVEANDGSLRRKAVRDLLPEDRLVIDGPQAFSGLATAQAALEAEITAAGGLDAWRAASTGLAEDDPTSAAF